MATGANFKGCTQFLLFILVGSIPELSVHEPRFGRQALLLAAAPGLLHDLHDTTFRSFPFLFSSIMSWPLVIGWRFLS